MTAVAAIANHRWASRPHGCCHADRCQQSENGRFAGIVRCRIMHHVLCGRIDVPYTDHRLPISGRQKARTRVCDCAYGLSTAQDRLLCQSLCQILVEGVLETLGIEPRLVRSDEHGQILGHLSAFDGGDDDLLQSFGGNGLTSGVLSRSARCFEPPVHAKMEAIGLVEVFRPSASGDNGGSRCRAVFGFDGLPSGSSARRSLGQGAESLCDGVGLHVAIVVLASPDIAAMPLGELATMSSMSRCS